MPILVGENVTKSIGSGSQLREIIHPTSFVVEKGEFLGIMGPSGAGKSTLLKVMSTMLTPTGGKVFLNGENIARLKEKALGEIRNEQLGFVFQDFNLVENLTVEDNLALPLVIGKKENILEKVTKMSTVLGLKNLLKRYPKELSIGQKQRVAVGRALINEPDIIFADEPTGSLDSKNATELLRYLEKINQNQGTILMVTHDAYTASFCQRILFIKDGSIFSELFSNGNRQEFLKKILQMQAAIGGDLFRD